jgi:hypothetical protein
MTPPLSFGFNADRLVVVSRCGRRYLEAVIEANGDPDGTTWTAVAAFSIPPISRSEFVLPPKARPAPGRRRRLRIGRYFAAIDPRETPADGASSGPGRGDRP